MTNDLNARWASDGLCFEVGPGNLPVAVLAHDGNTATVALHGAHVLAYQPKDTKPVLWLSREAVFAEGKPIRGGIPVCWPWFANHPLRHDFPAHGFARTRAWEILETKQADSGCPQIVLGLKESEETLRWFPHRFSLRMEITLSNRLEVRLCVHNLSDKAFTHTAALHSYFNVSQIERVYLEGLSGRTYIDSLDDAQKKVQEGPIRIGEEVDRIYLDTEDTCSIIDEEWQRTIRVSKSGSRSTVVWNPWIAKAQRMTDFGDDEYPGMLCVETANAATDAITLSPGAHHDLGLEIAVE